MLSGVLVALQVSVVGVVPAILRMSDQAAPLRHPVLTALWHVRTPSSKLSKYQMKRLLDTRALVWSATCQARQPAVLFWLSCA